MSINSNEMEIKTPSSGRFIELDVFRGIAIGLMIYLHILWDLDYFGIYPLNHEVYQVQKIVPLIFFMLVGMCLVVGKNKKIANPLTDELKKYHRHLIMRGIKIFMLGIAITIATLIFVPNRPIIFGVLHFIGLSVILSIPFLKLKYYNILFALLFILIGILIGNYHIENPTVFHLALGIHQTNVWDYTVDYFPLFPWFGVTLLGIALGEFLYKDNKRRFHLPDLSRYRPFTMLSWIGKHSLAIYMLHQPLIAGMLSIFILV